MGVVRFFILASSIMITVFLLLFPAKLPWKTAKCYAPPAMEQRQDEPTSPLFLSPTEYEISI